MIESAKENGIRVLATGEKEIPGVMIKEDLWGEDPVGSWQSNWKLRQSQWVDGIADHVAKNPNDKVMLVTSQTQPGIDSKLPDLLTSQLKRNDLKPLAIDVIASARTGGESLYERAARQAGMSLKRFSVPVDQEGFRPSDHIVNVPVNTTLHIGKLSRIYASRENNIFDEMINGPAWNRAGAASNLDYLRR
jgi:hypothetical protein